MEVKSENLTTINSFLPFTFGVCHDWINQATLLSPRNWCCLTGAFINTDRRGREPTIRGGFLHSAPAPDYRQFELGLVAGSILLSGPQRWLGLKPPTDMLDSTKILRKDKVNTQWVPILRTGLTMKQHKVIVSRLDSRLPSNFSPLYVCLCFSAFQQNLKNAITFSLSVYCTCLQVWKKGCAWGKISATSELRTKHAFSQHFLSYDRQGSH